MQKCASVRFEDGSCREASSGRASGVVALSVAVATAST